MGAKKLPAAKLVVLTKHWRVLELFYLDHMTVAQVSERLGMPTSSVHLALSEAWQQRVDDTDVSLYMKRK